MRRLFFSAIAVSFLISGLAFTGADAAAASKRPAPMAFIDPAQPACFSRSYSAAHMASHPRQTVTDIAFIYLPTQVIDGETVQHWVADGEFQSLTFFIAVRLRNGAMAPLMGAGVCQPSGGNRLACGLDEDSGTFDLRTAKDGYMLENKSNFVVMPATGNYHNDSRNSTVIDRRDDHDAFLLRPSRGGLCDARFPPRTDAADWN